MAQPRSRDSNYQYTKGDQRSIAHYYECVWNQQDTPYCMPFAASHMLTILYRQLFPATHSHVEVSPKTFLVPIAENPGGTPCVGDILQLRIAIVGKGKGPQDIHVQPFDTQMITEMAEFVEGCERFWVDALLRYETEADIIAVIADNFFKLLPPAPLLGSCDMRGLIGARAAETSSINPFRPDQNAEEEEGDYDHAVLIVEAYIASIVSFTVHVKIRSSYGTNWGVKGYAWIICDIFNYVIQPVKCLPS